jgi:hypothetical protein
MIHANLYDIYRQTKRELQNGDAQYIAGSLLDINKYPSNITAIPGTWKYADCQ